MGHPGDLCQRLCVDAEELFRIVSVSILDLPNNGVVYHNHLCEIFSSSHNLFLILLLVPSRDEEGYQAREALFECVPGRPHLVLPGLRSGATEPIMHQSDTELLRLFALDIFFGQEQPRDN